MKKETKMIHAEHDESTGAIISPIHLSTIFAQDEPGKHKGFEYSRVDNPTRSMLEKKIAELESGKFALAFSSGQGAAASVLCSLKAGNHVLCSEDVYEGTLRLFEKIFGKFGVEWELANFRDCKKIEKSIKPNTRLIWIETPSNPLLRITDIRGVSKIAKKHNIITLVDSSFAPPCIQKPLELGADIVLHSLGKYISGHNDVTAGAIALSNRKLFEDVKFIQHTLGAVPSPLDCFLVLRGIKTLSVRLERQQKNAFEVAEFLESHKKIEKVMFPGLSSHPDHDKAKKQMSGFGGVVSFYIKRNTKKFLRNLKLISMAQSYGGIESTIQHPTSMMDMSLSNKKLEELGITKNLVRMSVGLEDVDDIIGDLKQALERI